MTNSTAFGPIQKVRNPHFHDALFAKSVGYAAFAGTNWRVVALPSWPKTKMATLFMAGLKTYQDDR